MKYWLLSMIMIMALITPISGQAQTSTESLNQQVQEWTKQLGDHDSRFAAFMNASFDLTPLRHGSHQWIATFRSDGKTLGYMIVSEQEKDLSLLEYGLGSSPLFDPMIVAPFLSSQDESLQPYYSGLESVWVSKEGIYDAKSGEKYPTQVADHEHEQVVSSVGKHAELQSVFNKKAGDCLCWIKPEGKIQNQTDFLQQVKKRDVSLLAELFDSTVKAPYHIQGYHIWNGEVFMEIKDYGSRFLPYSYVTSLGSLTN